MPILSLHLSQMLWIIYSNRSSRSLVFETINGFRIRNNYKKLFLKNQSKIDYSNSKIFKFLTKINRVVMVSKNNQNHASNISKESLGCLLYGTKSRSQIKYNHKKFYPKNWNTIRLHRNNNFQILNRHWQGNYKLKN